MQVRDDNDRYLAGTLPVDPFADAVPVSSDADCAGVEPWGEPLPITPIGDVPSFPVEVFPAWLRDWAIALADALQCPLDLPAMLALAVLSLSSAKKYTVQVRSDWEEPINLYVAVALKPGEAKSPAFVAATRPVARFVAEERRRRDPEMRLAEARADIAGKRIEQLKARAAKVTEPAEDEKLLKLIEDAIFEQGAAHVPAPLRLILDDATAESLEAVLRQQGGAIGIMSDEGGPFELMGGRYSDGVPNLDVYLKGHSGSPISTDRIGREGGSVQSPAITIGLTVQPDVITALKDKKGFRGRGLLARFLWSVPKSLVGTRLADSPPMPDEVRRAYEEGVTSLLEVSAEKDELGEIRSQAIVLSSDAYALLVEFKRRIEPRLGPSGDLEGIADWANKIGGTVVRLAGLLHLADRAGTILETRADPLDEPSEQHVGPIGEDEMRRAMRIAEFLTAHALVAFDLMQSDPVARGARHILAWIERTGVESFSRREAYQASRAWFQSPTDMEPALELLIDHEVIRQRPTPPRSGPGRPPSPVFDVNPAIRARNAQHPVSGQAAGDSVHSVQGWEQVLTPSSIPMGHQHDEKGGP